MRPSISITTPESYVSKDGKADSPADNLEGWSNVEAVAYNMVHSYPGGVAAIAEAMGISKGVLTHKINPNNTTFHLTLAESIKLQKITRDVALLQAIAAELGYVAIPCVRRPDVLTPFEALTNLAAEFANTMKALADPIHRATANGAGPLESVSISEENRVNFMAAGLIEAIGDAQASMRALRRETPKAGGKG